jgi:hypothetical protein
MIPNKLEIQPLNDSDTAKSGPDGEESADFTERRNPTCTRSMMTKDHEVVRTKKE